MRRLAGEADRGRPVVGEEDTGVSLVGLFRNSTPYWVIMLLAVTPQVATALPRLVF